MTRGLPFAAAALVSLAVAPARADSKSDRGAAAQALFEAGKDLLEHGHVAEACPKFAESQRLDPGLGTMLWLADCYEANGQTASAWVGFKEAAAEAALHKDKREKVARDRAAALEPKLARVAIQVPGEVVLPGIEVRRDGFLVGQAEWGIPVPVDPGVHTVSARAPGHREWSVTVQLAKAAELLPVTVPVLEAADAVPAAPAQEPGAAVAPSPAAATVPSAESSAPGSTQRTLGLVAGGLGVAGLAVGAYLGLQAKATYDGSNQGGHCLPDNECDATGKQDRSSAQSQATGSTIAFVAGAALAAGGAVLYLTAPRERSVAVSVLPGRAGVLVTARIDLP